MVIDIDAFLDDYKPDTKSKVEKKKEISEEKVGVVDLDFQKQALERIKDFQNQISQNPELKFIKTAYDELKKYDETLPVKFFTLEEKGNTLLGSLSENYSSKYLSRVKQSVDYHSQKLEEQFSKIDQIIVNKDFMLFHDVYMQIQKLLSSFPREFSKEKLAFQIKLREKENEFNNLLDAFKSSQFHLIKSKIREELSKLVKLLTPGMSNAVEEQLEKVNRMADLIPKVFMSELLEEKKLLTKGLLRAEDYLEKEYERVYESKEKMIRDLIEKFQGKIISKNLDSSLLIYNEILQHFTSLPDVFLERKVILFNEINELYKLVSNLVLHSNVNMFIESFNSGKVLEEVQDYLDSVRKYRRVSNDSLNTLKMKLNTLPERYSKEKKEYLQLIENLENGLNQRSQEFKEEDYDNQNYKQEEISKNMDVDYSEFHKRPNKGNENISSDDERKLMEHLGSLYTEFVHASSKEDVSRLYKQLISSIRNLNVPDSRKQEIKMKINKVLSSKKIS